MELKNYLHLYLGCNVLMSDGKNILPLTGISGSLAISDFIEGAELNLIHIPIHTCRPILRPLSDIQPDEYEYMNQSFSLLDSNSNLSDSEKEAERIRYMLSKHFDLFQLIEHGLAIDAATLKEATNGK